VLVARVGELEEALRVRVREMETSMPYLNRVIEEKKNNELELEKRNSEIKKLGSLLEMAKKSKAEEIVALTRDLQASQSKLTALQG
jgi:hypothetical protein